MPWATDFLQGWTTKIKSGGFWEQLLYVSEIIDILPGIGSSKADCRFDGLTAMGIT